MVHKINYDTYTPCVSINIKSYTNIFNNLNISNISIKFYFDLIISNNLLRMHILSWINDFLLPRKIV